MPPPTDTKIIPADLAERCFPKGPFFKVNTPFLANQYQYMPRRHVLRQLSTLFL